MAFFRASVQAALGDGTRIKFWTDAWLQGKSIAQIAPHLFNAVRKGRCASCMVAEALQNRRWIRDITGALTILVLGEYIQIREMVDPIVLQPDPDRFIWKWSADGKYNSQSAYHAMFLCETAVAGAHELWKSRIPSKCKFHIWLVLHE